MSIKNPPPFSFDTIKDFDSHIRLSIPYYRELVEHLLSLSSYFVRENHSIIDIGCSSGFLLTMLAEKFGLDKYSYYGADITSAQFPPPMGHANFFLERRDIAECGIGDTKKNPCLAFSIFTLQFLPRERRAFVLNDLYRRLPEGGALIVAEKVYSSDGLMQEILNFSHYDFKRKNFSEAEILSKQNDLRTIMRPLTEEENLAMFKEAGFISSQCFWRSLNFAAWILVK